MCDVTLRSMIIPSHSSDTALLERMAKAECDAVGELYDRHGAMMYGLALKMVGDPEVAQDVLLDAMAQLYHEATRQSATIDRVSDRLKVLVRDHAIRKVRDRHDATVVCSL